MSSTATPAATIAPIRLKGSRDIWVGAALIRLHAAKFLIQLERRGSDVSLHRAGPAVQIGEAFL